MHLRKYCLCRGPEILELCPMERLLALIRPGFKEAEPDCKTHPGQTRSHTPNPCPRPLPVPRCRRHRGRGEWPRPSAGRAGQRVRPGFRSRIGGRSRANRLRIAGRTPCPIRPPPVVQFWTPQRRDEDLIGGAVIQRRRKPLAAFRLFSSSQCSLES